MPANFPTADQKRYYGRYEDDLTPEELGRYFHLANTDRRLIYRRTREHTQLGIAVQIGTVRFLGTFLSETQWHTVPHNAVRYVAAQLKIAPAKWEQYLGGRRATFSDHQTLIRQHDGYRDFNDPAEEFATLRWLYTRVRLHDESPSQLFDRLVVRLKERKVLLPGLSTLERLINRIRNQVSERIWACLDRQLTTAHRDSLQALVTSEDLTQTPLDRLRHGPVVISPGVLETALERIKELRQVGLNHLDVSWLAPDRLKKLARHAGLSKAYTIDRLGEPRKWATLAAFVYVYETIAIDEALDVFDALVQTRLTRASQQGEKERLRTLRDLDAVARQLRDAGDLLLSLKSDELVDLNEVFFTMISREQLTTAIRQVDTLTRPPDDNYYENLLNHYSQFRRFLPTFWDTLEFEGLDSEVDLLEALAFLKGLELKKLRHRFKIKNCTFTI